MSSAKHFRPSPVFEEGLFFRNEDYSRQVRCPTDFAPF